MILYPKCVFYVVFVLSFIDAVREVAFATIRLDSMFITANGMSTAFLRSTLSKRSLEFYPVNVAQQEYMFSSIIII